MEEQMSYCFVRVTDNYPQQIKNFYLNNPEIQFGSYVNQYKALTDFSYETAISYSKNLNKIGVEAYDIISNAHFLQNKWKEENNLPKDLPSQELIIQQLKSYRPDAVWIDDFTIINSQWKTRLLREVPSIKLVIGHICAPYNSEIAEKFKLFDIMFTCIPCFKEELAKQGVKTYLLYHAFETSLLNNINTGNNFPESEFLFSGSLYTGSGFHKSRIEYIEKMLASGINMDLYCNLESKKKVLVKKTMYTVINSLKAANLDFVTENVSFLRKHKSYGDVPIKYYSKKLIESSRPPVFGYEMYQLLSKAKICFNIHGEVAEKCAGNIRLFEATGVGSCLVTDWKENINDLFEPDTEIVTYKSVDECIDKVKWLINNPIEREKIAKAGQKRTLKDHTFENRAKVLDEIIKNEIYKN